MKKIFLFILALILSFITFLNLFAEESIVSSEVMADFSTVAVDSPSPMLSESSSGATHTESSIAVMDSPTVSARSEPSVTKDVEN